jgi:hypothetical protein
MTPVLSTKNNINDENLFDEPYERLMAEFQALSPESVGQVNLDIPTAVSTTLGVLPELRSYRDEIVAKLPGFDIARFDRMEDYAMAVSHANTLFMIANQPPSDLQALHDEGATVRDTLLSDVNALISRGLINASAIKDLKGPVGHKNLATDLQILASVLKDSWSVVQGKCAAQPEELDHAAKLAARLLRVVGLKEQGPALIATSADIRARAFTQFTRAYDDARRAVIFLRWHEGDADEIAPSLYAGRSNGRKKATEVAATPAVAPAPAANALPGNSPAPVNTTAATQPSNAANVSAAGPYV